MIQTILAILDSRSFGTIWFWMLLAVSWSLAGRRVVGVPFDIVQGALRPGEAEAEHPGGLVLLDWLSLTLPRWRITPTEGSVLLGLAAFALTALFLLGFVYGLEMAQALVLLILPFALLVPAEMRLAGQLRDIIHAAGAGAIPVNDAARQAAGLMRRHRRIITVISVIVVGLTAYRGALWLISHPFGV